MTPIALDIDQIVHLGTQVAQAGAIRFAEMVGDEVFDYIIAVAMVTSASVAGALAG